MLRLQNIDTMNAKHQFYIGLYSFIVFWSKVDFHNIHKKDVSKAIFQVFKLQVRHLAKESH